MPIDAFNGSNPEFKPENEVYYYMLEELADASSQLDLTAPAVPNDVTKYDQAYGFNYLKWKKYANSLRLRLAMRISEVDPSKSKSEFEAAAAGPLITAADDIFGVDERPGWDALTGVMSREWNSQLLSATLNNLYIGLGSIPSSAVLPEALHGNIKMLIILASDTTIIFLQKLMTHLPDSGWMVCTK